MKINVKLIVPFVLFCLSAVTACSLVPVMSDAENPASLKVNVPQVVDMGYKNGATFAVQINIGENEGFSIKATDQNQPGHAYIGSDINMVKVFIFADAGFSSGDPITPDASMPSGNPITLTTKTGTSSGGSFDVVFTNVKGNTVPWRVAVSALTTKTEALGSTGTPKNITLATGSYGTFNSENYGVSNAGGDGAGTVLIDTVTLSLSGTDALVVPITLIDLIMAQLDANIEINNGSPSITPGSTYLE